MGWKKYQKIYIYQIKKKILNADVENCGSFKSFGYIYIDNKNKKNGNCSFLGVAP